MTREEILAMEPGRELDALVAEKVMGQSMWFSQNGSSIPIPSFSADISAAWEVVEKLNSPFFVRRLPAKDYAAGLGCGIGRGKTAPEAICKAALLAMEEE